MNEQLYKLKVELSKQLIYTKLKSPRFFVFIDDVMTVHTSLDAVCTRMGFSKSAFYKCVNFDKGVIYDPVASMLYTHEKDIRLYDSTYVSTREVRRVRGHAGIHLYPDSV